MSKINHAVIIGILAGVALAGIVVLVALGHPVPDVLSTVAVVGVSALAGLAIPVVAGGIATTAAAVAAASTPTVPAEPPAAAPAPVQEALSGSQSPETVAPGVVVPGMSPVQALQAGGS